jgi:coproporphyrinogen III oxidase-like Fe-S oxidoreductase
MEERKELDELIQNTPKWTIEHFDHLKKIKTSLDAERLEWYQLAVKGKELDEEDLQDLIDRARAIKGMEKIDWKSLDK